MTRNAYSPPQALVADATLQQIERPAQVTNAARLLWVALGLDVVGSTVEWPYLSLRGVGAALYVQLFTLAILAWLIHKMSRGRNWARIAYLVLLAAGLVAWLTQVSSLLTRSPISGLIEFLELALQAWAMYWVFSEPGRRWFRAPKPE